MNITRHDGDAPPWLMEAIQKAAGAGVRAAAMTSPLAASNERANAVTAFLQETAVLNPPTALVNLWLFCVGSIQAHLPGDGIRDVLIVGEDGRELDAATHSVTDPQLQGIVTSALFLADMHQGCDDRALERYTALWQDVDTDLPDGAARAVVAGTMHLLAVAGELVASAHADQLPPDLIAGRDQVLAARRDGLTGVEPKRSLWGRLLRRTP